MLTLLIGIIASATHVITGPDHLAAVTPLAIENKNKSWKIGISWGIGHTLGLLSIGVLFYFFRSVIPVKLISEYSEIMVGVILIALGLWAFYKLSVKHNHKHEGTKNVSAAIFVGLLHGFAGIYHLLIVLPTLALPTKIDALLYLIGFAIGTILIMGIYAYSLGFISEKAKNKNNFLIAFRIFGGSSAIIVGVIWIVLAI